MDVPLDVDAQLARSMRPWVLGAWVLLTLGITAGSYWAYYELGWGGYWFWDPVENASLMPWLAATAGMTATALVVWPLASSVLMTTADGLGAVDAGFARASSNQPLGKLLWVSVPVRSCCNVSALPLKSFCA